MERVYQYLARTGGGQSTEGMIVASDEDAAFSILRQRGLQPLAVDFSFVDTANLFLAPKFSPDALAAYYTGLGLRLKNGMDAIEAVDDMRDQPSHFRVKLCASEFLNFMRSGLKLGQAMEKAGFPERDCYIIQALEQGAKVAKGYENMARDYARTSSIQKNIKGMLLEPAFMGIVGILAVWATMVFAVPIFQKVFREIASAGVHVPAYAQGFYHFSDLFDAHVVMDSILYYGFFVVVVVFLRSRVFKKLLDQLSTLRKFSEIVDNAALWGGFQLLIDTSMSPQVIPDMLAKSAHRADTRAAFEAMGILIKRGEKYPQAIRLAGFPSYIGKDAASAMEAPGIQAQTESLNMMNNILAMRVEEMAGKVVTLSHILTTVGAGVMVLLIMMFTFMPVMITELHMA